MVWTEGLAKSLKTLLDEVDAAVPDREKGWDGTIGDTAHSARKSDHNKDSDGIVRALDITHDPGRGFDSYKFADALKALRDERISYVISNGRIWNPSVSSNWREYNGLNDHSHHVHVSVKGPPHRDKTGHWAAVDTLDGRISTLGTPPLEAPPKTIRVGSTGKEVDDLWVKLAGEENSFGPILEAAVRAYQKSRGLVVDGVVGPHTWSSFKK